jgi:putative SOS response-associated peptidase YedK
VGILAGGRWSELETAAIVTTEPNAVVAQIYTRMPAVILPENFTQWLDVKNVDAGEAVQFLEPAPD